MQNQEEENVAAWQIGQALEEKLPDDIDLERRKSIMREQIEALFKHESIKARKEKQRRLDKAFNQKKLARKIANQSRIKNRLN